MPTVRATNTTSVYSLGGDSAGAHSSSFFWALAAKLLRSREAALLVWMYLWAIVNPRL
jgi:hypothetical protein